MKAQDDKKIAAGQSEHLNPNISKPNQNLKTEGSLTMKLLRYGPKGQEKPGLLDQNGKIRDLSKVVGDIAGETLSDSTLANLRALDPASVPEGTAGPRSGPSGAPWGHSHPLTFNSAHPPPHS